MVKNKWIKSVPRDIFKFAYNKMNSLMQKSFLIIKHTTSIMNGVMVALTD